MKKTEELSLSPKDWDPAMKCTLLQRPPFRASPLEGAKHKDFRALSISHKDFTTMVGTAWFTVPALSDISDIEGGAPLEST